MSEVDCKHLDEKGICQGKYKGFGCIDEKCKDPTRAPRSAKCRHGRSDGYCKKHKKFECQDQECDDYEV